MGLLVPECLRSGTDGLQSRRWAPAAPLRRLNIGLDGSPRPPWVLQVCHGLFFYTK